MNVKQIRLENFKNIKNSIIEFRSNLSGIYGPNGTGKTSIVEALEVLKLYFSNTSKYINNNQVLDKILKHMTIGKQNMVIEAIFVHDDTDFKVLVEFVKDSNGGIFVSREEFSQKQSKARRKFQHIAKIKNDDTLLLPEIFIGGTNTTNSNILIDFLDTSNFKQLLKNFSNLNTFFLSSFIHTDKKKLEDPNFKILKDSLENLKIVENLIKNIVVVTLSKQALYKDTLVIPINYGDGSDLDTINYSTQDNIFNKKDVDCLKRAAKNIDKLLSIIIPDSRFILEEKVVGVDENDERTAINLFLVKKGIKIPLTLESTGTIKLVSLLSILIVYIQNEKAIIVIDELDIHIFEYLLAVLLETMAPLAKGQLIFTGHNLLPMEKLGKDSIIIATESNDDIIYTFMKGISNSTNIRQKYLRSQALWSEDNIEPLHLNIPALNVFVKGLVLKNGN
ncbi:MAG: AAA family ATPase [Cetobacterium sp.]|uniref:AAA family ATPase n=1 Tax=Cetobacterium sp. TaxID=2071632 RepID=UPI003F33F51B